MEQSMVKLRIAEAEKMRFKQIDSASQVRLTPGGKLDKDGKYYLVRLEMEIEKIQRMIGDAELVAREHIPEEALGKIRNAVGKAQLLINKKFKQFNELCRDNIIGTSEADPDKKETKPSDLEGYWEMMYIQIEDVRNLFDDIEKLRACNWQVQESYVDGHTQNGSQASVTPKSKRKSGGKSPRTKVKSSPTPTVDQEKVRREARSRMAAARKLAKERMEVESEKNTSPASLDSLDVSNDDLEISINGQCATPKKHLHANDSDRLNLGLEESLDENSCLDQSDTPADSASCSRISSLSNQYEREPTDDSRSRPDGAVDSCDVGQRADTSDQLVAIVTTPPDVLVTHHPPSTVP